MDALECIRTRRSVRSFRPDDIDEGTLNEVLEAATLAPSAGNVQDWEFIVVKDAERKQRLAEAALGQKFVAQAPVVIVACSDLEAIGKAYGSRGTSLYSAQNIAAAVENLMLAAWDRGVGSCWVGTFNEAKVKDTLILPPDLRPLVLIPMGRPAEAGEKPARKALGEVTHSEFFH